MATGKNALGQYFTPRNVADLMVSLLRSPKSAPVLEPSAGEGVFLDSLTSAGFTSIEAVELDKTLLADTPYDVTHTSFVSWKTSSRFSAVIGNPPYIRWKNLAPEQQEEVKQHRLWGELFNSLSDYLTIFIANSVEHLEDSGELVFITPSFWMRTKHSGELRRWLLNRGEITDIIDFGESSVFKGVSSDIVIFRYQVGKSLQGYVNRWQYVGQRKIPQELNLDDEEQFNFEELPPFDVSHNWSFASCESQANANRLEDFCAVTTDDLFGELKVPQLGDYVRIANGMVSGLDKAFQIPDESLAGLNQREQNSTMRVLKAKDMNGLNHNRTRTYINAPVGLSQADFESNYPDFAKLLSPYRDDLEKRYSYGRDLPYWEWAFRRSENFFTNDSAKVFVPCKERLTCRDYVRFSLVPSGVVATQDMTALAPLEDTKESVEYIFAFLSLPMITDWIRVRGLMKGGVAEFSERPVHELPFRRINWESKQEVAVHEEITKLVQDLVKDNNLDELREKAQKLFAQL